MDNSLRTHSFIQLASWPKWISVLVSRIHLGWQNINFSCFNVITTWRQHESCETECWPSGNSNMAEDWVDFFFFLFAISDIINDGTRVRRLLVSCCCCNAPLILGLKATDSTLARAEILIEFNRFY